MTSVLNLPKREVLQQERFGLDAYDMWERLPASIQECIPAPASNSYSRMVPPGGPQRQLIATLAVLGARELTADEKDTPVWRMVDEGGVTVMSSTEKMFAEGDGSAVAWVYLPSLCRLVLPDDDRFTSPEEL